MKSFSNRIGLKALQLGALLAVSALASSVILLGSHGCTTQSSNPGNTSTEQVSSATRARADSPASAADNPVQDTDNPKKPANQAALTRIIFITTSQACDCTMRRCRNGEQALNEALSKQTYAPQIERIDFARERDRAMGLVKKYSAMMLPIIYFIDQKDDLLQKLEGEFSAGDVSEILNKYARGAK